ncbi:MAG: acetyl-CoA carboxylase carboxyltransferase subunit alpha [Syntrophomonadaceae bacterium]|nr:acetyl-CoA carboxylase carboxyltransferase subunit alpha [Syntrophomonadaceae bacterium]
MVKRHFDYEEKYRSLREKFQELKKLSQSMDFDLNQEFKRLEDKMEDIRGDKYHNLSPWEKVLLSRHSGRPVVKDYIEYLFEDWIELHGDRSYGEDRAIIGGIAAFAGIPVTVLGHQKGRDTNENLKNNFGMPHPEGFRKVERLIGQAEKFKRPVITFIDTPGAYPGLGAEERGQAWAIARVLMLFPRLQVPTIAIVTGEGGSGGALALAVADRLLMLSNSVFSVASAEACASIIWKDAGRAEEMASYLKVTAQDLSELGIADEIIQEPIGGAHQDFTDLADRLKKSLELNLKQLMALEMEQVLEQRYQKFRGVGRFLE